MYLSGTGVPADPKEAVNWFSMAADNGSWEAEIRLGDLLSDEKGPVYDKEKAMEWYRKATEHGDVYAQYRLGGLYETETGLERQMECLKWYSMAARNGNEDAKKHLMAIGFSA